MSTLKTIVDSKVVKSFLVRHFSTVISQLESIKGGETSQAFSFAMNDKAYVIRVHTTINDFKKEKYAYEHFASNKIPIPKFIGLGKIDSDYYYAITERANGDNLDVFNFKTRKKLVSQLFTVLDAIHAVDISGKSGFGDLEDDGNAHFRKWKDFLLSVNSEDYFHWSQVFQTTIMKKDVFDLLYKKLIELIQYCPEERALVHGDFGFSNVISDGERITGVVDWSLMIYGDPIYDVAWLDLWSEQIPFGKLYKERISKNTKFEQYEERLTCYKIHQGIGALEFFAKSGQEKSYKWLKERLTKFAF
ncbi:MAG: phosphotransferase [Candidatus Levybacteria bacterium]|nr:phosphotransferase [Candidatus Levybacteria bacterium]